MWETDTNENKRNQTNPKVGLDVDASKIGYFHFTEIQDFNFAEIEKQIQTRKHEQKPGYFHFTEIQDFNFTEIEKQIQTRKHEQKPLNHHGRKRN